MVSPLQELLTVTAAGGTVLPYDGFVELNLSINPTSPSSMYPVLALVLPGEPYSSDVPMVIGTNVIQRYLDDHQDQDIELSPAWIMALSSMKKKSPANGVIGAIKTTQSETIPPRCRMIVRGLMRSSYAPSSQNTYAMMEATPYHALPGGLLVTPTVMEFHDAHVSTYRISVELQNLSTRPVMIPAKAVLCDLHRVSVESEEEPLIKTSDPAVLNKFDWPEDRQHAQLLKELLSKWSDAFCAHDLDYGHTDKVRHRIKLSDNNPIKIPHRRIPPGVYSELKDHLKEMIEGHHIRPSESPWSFPVVLVRKKDNSLRFCVDYRELNKRTIKDAYALPRIEETMDHLHGAKFFSCLDLKSGYWQVEMAEEDKEKTAFTLGPLGFF